MMPSDTLFESFDDDLVVRERTVVCGTEYARTSEHWLQNLDARRDAALAALATVHGKEAALWLRRWRIFFMACAELFAWDEGRQWHVTHTLFARKDAGRAR